MAESPGGIEFPSTRWSLVERARGPDAFFRREALESLVRLYWPALRAHLVIRRRLSAEAADDLLQGFAADRILQQRFLGHADPGKGRFRSFLLRCVENYHIDRERAKRPTAPLDDDLAAPDDDADAFDVAWARQVLAEALRRMRDDCQSQDRMAIWTLFDERVLRPALGGTVPPSYEQLIGELGFESPEQAANALVTAKRHFRRVLEGVIAQYVESEDEVQNEINDLRAILARASLTGAVEVPGPAAQPLLPFSLAAERQGIRGIGNLQDDLTFHFAATDTNPSSLARFFPTAADRDVAWEPLDLAATLNRLLALPPEKALPGFASPPGAWAMEHAASCEATDVRPPTSDLRPPTLADLFSHPNPPLAQLQAIKEWSRRSTRAKDLDFPSDISTLLYFAAIAAAHVRLGKWISKLDPELLREGIELHRAQPWIGEPFQSLFQAVVRDSGNANSFVSGNDI